MQLPVFLLFVAVINVGVCQECGNGWLHFQRHCYRYGDAYVSWADAQAICQSHGARLAEIPTLAVNNFLTTIAMYKRGTCVWIGGHDLFQEGNWEWSSGLNDFYSFKNWHSGEPSNRNNDEDCLSMSMVHNYNWNDGDCNYNCNFICVKDAS